MTYRGWCRVAGFVLVGVVFMSADLVLAEGVQSRVTTEIAPEVQKYQEDLHRLLEAHPATVVRDTLTLLIREGIVFLNFDDDLMQGGEGTIAVLVLNVEGYGLAPVFYVHPRVLMGQHEKGERERSILHETLHLMQLFKGRASVEGFLPQEVLLPVSREEASIEFENDHEAFCAECALAIAMQWRIDDPVCAAYARGGPTALRQTLAALFRSDNLFKEVSSLFDTLAVRPVSIRNRMQ